MEVGATELKFGKKEVKPRTKESGAGGGPSVNQHRLLLLPFLLSCWCVPVKLYRLLIEPEVAC